jgi:HEAT repeat protein
LESWILTVASGNRKEAVEQALLDLASSLKAIQLYPSTSAVVQNSIRRTLDLLAPLIKKEPIVVDILPSFMRMGETELGEDNYLLTQLAVRLHGLGIARLHLDDPLDMDSFRGFCELLITDRRTLDARGGLGSILDGQPLDGVQVEMLQIGRVFEASSSDSPDDVWETLLDGYQDAVGGGEINWAKIAANVDKLRHFVDWLLSAAGSLEVLAGQSQADVLRFVCEKVGVIAESLGGDHVNFLVLAVRDLFDRIEPDALVELLAEPMPVSVAVDMPRIGGGGKAAAAFEPTTAADGGQESPCSGAGGATTVTAGNDETEDTSPASPRQEVDITGEIAQGMSPEQVQALVLHTLRANDGATPRLYGLIDRLMMGRNDRDELAHQVREFLDQEIASFGTGEGWLDKWPLLTDALRGDSPDRFMSENYQATLAHLSEVTEQSAAWPMDKINPRMTELSAPEVFERKCQVLLAMLEQEDRDQEYETVADSLENTLPTLVSSRQYELAEAALATFKRHAEGEAGRSDAQRSKAAESFSRFFNQQTLRSLVRESLSSGEVNAAAVGRLLQLGGPGLVPGLLEALGREKSREVRQRLMQMLAALGQDVLEDVREHLADGRWHFIRNLVLIIGEVADERFLPHLKVTLAHEDPRVRVETVLALMKMHGEMVSELLVGATFDGHRDVSLPAIHLLGTLRVNEGRTRLETLLDLPNWRGQNSDVIRTAAIALGRIGDPESMTALKRASARRPWIFRKRRLPAFVAASWAVAEIEGAEPGPAPELARLTELEKRRTSFIRREP